MWVYGLGKQENGMSEWEENRMKDRHIILCTHIPS